MIARLPPVTKVIFAVIAVAAIVLASVVTTCVVASSKHDTAPVSCRQTLAASQRIIGSFKDYVDNASGTAEAVSYQYAHFQHVIDLEDAYSKPWHPCRAATKGAADGSTLRACSKALDGSDYLLNSYIKLMSADYDSPAEATAYARDNQVEFNQNIKSYIADKKECLA